VRVLRGDAVGELVQVRLADVRVAGGLEPDDGLGGAVGDVVGEDDRPVGRDEPGRVEEVLDREPDSERWLGGPCEKDPVGRRQSSAR
jgi:hypothetical protein